MNTRFICCLASSACCFSVYSQIAERPNIIWLMAEDMGKDLECYGMKAVKTPFLNKLASQGVKYNAAHTTNPISSPSRSAMMTGVHQNVSNSHNHRSNRNTPLDPKIKPFTFYLRQHGYTTLLGHSLVRGKGRKLDCNFKHQAIGEWDGVNSFGLFDKYDDFTKEDQPFFAQIQLAVTHRGDWWNEITASSLQPVNPTDVELPPYLPEHPMIRKQWASYLDQVEYMDSEVGMLLEDLKAKGMIDNTIIFFIGDNGRCEVKGKGYLYQTGTNIPMIAWGKGIKPAVIDNLVSSIDISATILSLADIPIPEAYMGKELFNKASGEAIDGTSDYLYTARDTWDEVVECSRAIIDDRYKYIRNYMPQQGWDVHQQYLDFHRPAIHVLRMLDEKGELNDDQAKFMAKNKPVEELYDLKADPHEQKNLAHNPEYADVLQRMRQNLKEWQSNNVDKGLEDRFNRTSEDMGTVREFVKQNYPEDWEKLKEGGICQKYGFYRRNMTK